VPFCVDCVNITHLFIVLGQLFNNLPTTQLHVSSSYLVSLLSGHRKERQLRSPTVAMFTTLPVTYWVELDLHVPMWVPASSKSYQRERPLSGSLCSSIKSSLKLEDYNISRQKDCTAKLLQYNGIYKRNIWILLLFVCDSDFAGRRDCLKLETCIKSENEVNILIIK